MQALTLTLCLTTGGPSSTYTAVTDASGFFTVSVAGLAPGVYNWRDKGFRSLAEGSTLTLTGGNVSQEMGAQKGGDANNDNFVRATDFTVLKATYGTGGTDLPADFDNTGIVGVGDFNILKINFGLGGALVTCP
jgi:hypothetical protein